MVWTTNDEPAPIKTRSTIPVIYPKQGTTLKVVPLGDFVGIYVHYVPDVRRFLDCSGPGCRLCDKLRRIVKAYAPCWVWARIEKTGATGWKRCVIELPDDKAKPYLQRQCRGLILSISRSSSD